MWCIWEETSWWTWVGPSWWSTSLRYMLHQRSHVAFLPQSVTLLLTQFCITLLILFTLFLGLELIIVVCGQSAIFFLAVTLTRQMAFLYVLVFIVCTFWPNFIRQLWMFTHEHSYDLDWSGRRGHKFITCSWPVKGKSVPLQAWTGPEGSRKLRFPDFMTTAQDGGKVVSLTHRPPLPPGNAPGTQFC